MDNNFRIGDVYLIYFNGEHSEQRGWRPGVVFQNNTGNVYSPNVVVLPLTTSYKKMQSKLPTHVVVRADDTGLKKDSVVLCENPVSISKQKCTNYLTSIPHKYLKEIARAYIIASAALAFIDVEDIETILDIRNMCVSLNNITQGSSHV